VSKKNAAWTAAIALAVVVAYGRYGAKLGQRHGS